GLDLLQDRFQRLLEIGYGSGLLMPTLAQLTDELYGADLLPEAAGLREKLAQLGARPKQLGQADVQKLPFSDGWVDGAVAFSILEHLQKEELVRALDELGRVLREKGRLLVGCPAVHPLMNAAFFAIGFGNIRDHHYSSIGDVLAAAGKHFDVERRATLPR